mgnify:CR=1 FL=1
MRTQAQIEELFCRLYGDLGNDPADLVHIKPMHGKWEDALSYEVTRKDNKKTLVFRKELDDGNENNIKASLSAFA